MLQNISSLSSVGCLITCMLFCSSHKMVDFTDVGWYTIYKKIENMFGCLHSQLCPTSITFYSIILMLLMSMYHLGKIIYYICVCCAFMHACVSMHNACLCIKHASWVHHACIMCASCMYHVCILRASCMCPSYMYHECRVYVCIMRFLNHAYPNNVHKNI